MQSIKVLVKDPIPSNVGGGSFEDTMLLLEMVKEKQQKEKKELKVRDEQQTLLSCQNVCFQIFFINNESLPSLFPESLSSVLALSCQNFTSASF